jgi:hypothetical protein
MEKRTQKQKEINEKITLNYLTRVCDTSELERNCNKLYKLGYETIIISNEGQNKKLILAKRVK